MNFFSFRTSKVFGSVRAVVKTKTKIGVCPSQRFSTSSSFPSISSFPSFSSFPSISSFLSFAASFSSSPPSSRYVEVIRSEGGEIALISMERHEAKNAINRQFLSEFSTAISSLRLDSSVRVILIHSNVRGVFCAGADLKERQKLSDEDSRIFVAHLRDFMSCLEEMPQPTIACIDGVALGGGLELALACDFRVAGNEAVVGLPETSLAIIPGAGGTQRLPRLIGLQKAKYLILTAKRLTAKEGVEYGVLDFVDGVNEEKLLIMKKPLEERDPETSPLSTTTTTSLTDEEVKQLELLYPKFYSRHKDKEKSNRVMVSLSLGLVLAKQILANGPVAIRAAKRAMREGMEMDRMTAMESERMAYEEVLPTRDRREALEAFREKRKPKFEGR